MTIKINISKSKFNSFADYIGEQYIHPTNKKTLNDIRLFVAIELAKLGTEAYEEFGSIDFYNWISDKIARKFKLEQYPDFV